MLREWDSGDLAVMVELFGDPDVAYWTPLAAPFDLAAARAYLERIRTSKERVHLAITTEGLHPLGEVLLDGLRGTVGYSVGAAYRGRGLASRSVRLITEYAHGTVGLPAVYLEIEPGNHASVAVARATGYRLTDTAPVEVEDKGRVYSLRTWVHDAPR